MVYENQKPKADKSHTDKADKHAKKVLSVHPFIIAKLNNSREKIEINSD